MQNIQGGVCQDWYINPGCLYVRKAFWLTMKGNIMPKCRLHLKMLSLPSSQERVREVKPRLFLMFGFAFLRGCRSAYPYIPCTHSVLQYPCRASIRGGIRGGGNRATDPPEILLGHVPSCRGFVPILRGFVPILRGFVPNLRGFFQTRAIFVPIFKNFVPKFQ